MAEQSFEAELKLLEQQFQTGPAGAPEPGVEPPLTSPPGVSAGPTSDVAPSTSPNAFPDLDEIEAQFNRTPEPRAPVVVPPSDIPDAPAENPFADIEAQFGVTPETRQARRVDAAQQAADREIERSRLQQRNLAETFGAGVASGATHIVAAVPGVVGLAADFVGAEEAGKKLMGISRDISKLAPATTIRGASDIRGVGDAFEFAVGAIGEQIPMLGTIFTGGGLGSAVAKRFVERRLSSQATAEVLGKAARQGFTVGTLGTTFGIESAGTGQELFEATGEVHSGAAFTAGAIKAGLEAVTPLTIYRQFSKPWGLSPQVGQRYIDKFREVVSRDKTFTGGVLRAGVGIAGKESVTEGLQEAVDIATREFIDENHNLLSYDTAERLFNAVVAGGTVGFAFGSATRAIAGREPGAAEAPFTPATEEQASLAAVTTPQAATNLEDIVDGDADIPGTISLPEMDDQPNGIELTAGQSYVDTALGRRRAERLHNTTGVLTRQADGTLTVPTSGAQFVEMGTPAMAEARGAQQGISAAYVKADTDQISDDQITAHTQDLPANSSSGRVEYIGEAANRDVAMEHLDRAIFTSQSLRNLELAGTPTGDATMQQMRDDLVQDYGRALELGVRVDPGDGSGAYAIVSPREGQLKPVDSPPPTTRSKAHKLSVSKNPGTNVTTFERDSTDSLSAVALDLNQVDPASVTAEPDAALKEHLTREPRLAEGRDLAAADRAGIFFADGVSDTKAKELLYHFVGLMRAYEPDVGMTNQQKRRFVQLVNQGLRIEADPTAVRFHVIGDVASSQLAAGVSEQGISKSQAQTHAHVFQPYLDGIKSHKTTTVNVPPGLARGVKRLARITKRALDSVNIAANVHLIVAPQAWLHPQVMKYPSLDAGVANGQLIPITKDTGPYKAGDTIVLVSTDPRNEGTSRSSVEVLGTLAHELGHLVMYQSWALLDPTIQQKIITAYERWRIGVRNSSPEEIFRQTKEPGVINATRGLALEISDKRKNYYLSLDEWIADQFARYTIQKLPAITASSQWIKRVADKVLKVLRITKNLDPNQFQPVPEIQAWVDAMAARSEVNARVPSLTEIGTHAQAAEGAAQYADTLGPTQPAVQPSAVVQTFRTLRKALRVRSIVDKETSDKLSGIEAYISRTHQAFKWGLGVHQMSERTASSVPEGRKYVENARFWSNLQTQWIGRAEEHARAWRALGNAQSDKLSQFFFWTDKQDYLSKEEKAEAQKAGVGRWPTEEELLAGARKFGLSKEAMDVYIDVRNDFLDFLNAVERVSLDQINKKFIEAPDVREAKLAEAREQTARLRAEPYFPHTRFGELTLTVRNTEGKIVHFETFENKRDQLNAIDKAAQRYPDRDGFDRKAGKLTESTRQFQGMPPTVLQALKEIPGLSQEQLTAIEQLSFQMSPSESFRKRLMRRQDIPGYSVAGQQVYANYFIHGSRHLARMKYGDEMQQIILDIIKRAETTLKDSKPTKDMAAYYQRHFDDIMNPGPDWAQARSAAFIWYLGFNAASAVLNFVQIPAVAIPFLGAKYNKLLSGGKLTRAFLDANKSWTDLYKKGEFPSESPQRADARAQGMADGILNQSMATELAAQSNGSNLAQMLAGTEGSRSLAKIAQYAAFMFDFSEKVNRHITFTAAYELALENIDSEYIQNTIAQKYALRKSQLVAENGWGEKQALAYLAGFDAVIETQFDYAAHARPEFMRSKAGSRTSAIKPLLFTFYMYKQGMLNFAFRKDQSAARFWVMSLAIGGLMGAPGAEDLFALAKALGKKMFGKDWDVEQHIRKFITELTDVRTADQVMHGISREGFGLNHLSRISGVPIPEIDMSGAVSAGQIIPGLAEGLKMGEANQNAVIGKAVQDISGATFNIGFGVYNAIMDDQLPFNDPKRWERAMPKVVKNATKAYRLATEGQERTRTGAKFLDFDTSDPQHLAELVAITLGFQPARLTRKWSVTLAKAEAHKMWQTERGMILRQIDAAHKSGERGAIEKMRKEIIRFNREVPNSSMKITRKTVKKSLETRAKRRRQIELYGAPRNPTELDREIEKRYVK